MSVRRGDRTAAEEIVNLYRNQEILGYRVSRRRGICLVEELGRFKETSVDASEEVLDYLRRAGLPRFKGPWEKQYTLNPMGLPGVQALD